jgi:hypothetical protein
MAIAKNKTRCVFTLNTENMLWMQGWLKRNGAPPVMLSTMIDEYVEGMRHVLQELDKTGGKTSIGDLFKITGESLNRLKEPPLL